LHAFIESAFDTGCVVVSDDEAGESGLVFTYNLTDEIFAVDKKGDGHTKSPGVDSL